MKEKKLPFRKLFLGTLVFLLSATLHAQCPLTMPADNSSWGTANWTRKVYDGNWLLNSAGTAYVTPPTITTPATEDFGVDDYSGDVNFTGFSLPLPTEKVIRVGKKYGQPGQGLLSPVRSAAVATFTFTPTQNNCKIMMYYIGALQESSTDANLYSTVIANFRKDPDNQPASFGLFCRYNYTSPIPNSNTPSRAGKTEFGTVDLSSSSGTFTNNTANVSYGLNDMFSFYQYGTNSDTAPPSFSKVMTGWKSYTMDFSEFIGASVTVTLFANTSNYDGSSQNHSYCYYQFKCLNNQQASTLPTSNLSISYDETSPTTFDLGCFESNSTPINTPIQITNTNPTLLGGYSNATAINNNTSFKWLNLKTNSNTNIFNSNFASVTLELKDASGTYSQFNGISRSGTTTPTLTVPNPNFLLNIPSNYTTSTLVTNGTLYTYTFRVTYTTWKNPNPQIGYFTLKLTVLPVVPCNQDPNITVTIGGTNPSLVSTYSTTNTTTNTITNLDYGMCLPVSSSSVCNIKLDAGGTTCASSSYQWQRKKPNDLTWSNIANQTGISLSNAQSNLYTTACATLFRRVNVTSVSSSSGCSASIASESNNTVTIWNKSYMPYTATSNLVIADSNSNLTQSLSNVTTGKKIILCYGDQVTFTSAFRLGDLACSLPTSPTKSVTVQIVKNYVNGSAINSSDVLYTTTQNITNNQTSFITNPFSYTAINGAGFNFNGASTFALVPITIVVTSTVEGCSYTNTSLLVTFQIFPRALGGSILTSNCPIKVENNNAVPTVAYNSNDGNSSLPTDAYIWSYCTNYTPVPAPTNYECTGTNWTIIPGQGNIELSLAIASILNIPRPFIIKRTAKSGNNCGGMEDTAPIEISNSSRTLPNFTLPSTICLTTDSNNFPVANPAVSGNWYEYTIATTTATPPVQIPTIINIPIVNFNTLAAGAHDFIFIPDTQNNSTNVCYDFVKWHFTLLDAIPQFTQVPPICSGATLAPLPTTSLTGISGSWSPALNNTATTTYYFTPNPENCIPQVSMTIVVNPVQTPTFSLPNTLCVGATAPVLDNNSIEGINGLWTPTTIATAVAGNQNYTFTPTAGQCVTTATTTINITVTPKVTPTFSAMGPYCQNATPGILPLTSNNVINGTWSPATINTASGGTYTYTFTPAAGQCAIATTMKITIIANVIPTFNAIPDVCLNDTPPVLLTSSTNSPSITGTWNSTVSTTTVGTTFYTFTPNAGQCATTKLLSVTVKALPGLGGATSVCMGNTATLSPTSGGIWTSSATSVATVSGYTVTPVAPGTVTLSFTNSTTGCTNTKSFTVNNRVTPTFSFATTLCKGATAPTLLTISSNIINGTWSPTAINTNTVGTTNYTFTPATNQCAIPVTIPVTILPGGGTLAALNDSYAYGYLQTATTTGSILANDTLNGSSISTQNVTVALTGTLPTFSNGGITLNTNGTFAIQPYTAPGTYTFTYQLSYPCATNVTATATITIAPPGNSSCTFVTVWNGTSWSNGTPNTAAYLNTAVVFTANFDTTEDLYACMVLVTNGAVVNVKHIGPSVGAMATTTANTLTVTNEVVVNTGSNLNFEDDSSLVQINNSSNSGNIKYTRITPKINIFDYTYWSSPVIGQTLAGLSPVSVYYYWWNPLLPNWVYTANTATMDTGKGYIIRGPNLASYIDNKDFFYGFFNGVPNNGVLTTPVNLGTSSAYPDYIKMNLIGNPYPSALDIDCFLSDPLNAHLGGSIYLWTHNIPIDWSGFTQQGSPDNGLYGYNVNSYGAYNRMGGVGTGITSIVNLSENGSVSTVFNSDRCLGKVGAGQSFFIESNDTGVATFTNSMRLGSQSQQNSQFFKTTTQAIAPAETSACVIEERHRLWLQIINITATPLQFKQTLVGYSPLATTATTLDRNYDAKTFLEDPYTINLYSVAPTNEPLTIQGRHLTTPFDDTDVIPLGFTCKIVGTNPNTIQFSISEYDGLFNNQNIYLRITQPDGTYVYHDIKASSYTFNITSDVIDDVSRFAIVFAVPVGGVIEKSVMPSAQIFKATLSPNPFDKGFSVQLQSPLQDKVTLTLYDMLGKKIYTEELTIESLKNHIFEKNVSSGMYHAVITQGAYKETIKIIKN